MERAALHPHRHRRRRPRRPVGDHQADRRPGPHRDRRGRPRPFRRRRPVRSDARGRGGRGAAAALRPPGAADREQDRRPDQDGSDPRVPPARPRRAVADLGAARPRHRRPARHHSRASPGSIQAAGDPRGRDPRRDPRPAERREVEPAQRAGGRRARDRLRGARHDTRLDRHGRAAAAIGRSSSSTPPGSGASAASARGSSTTRSSARCRRPSGRTSRSSSSTAPRDSSTRT